jgi:exodeoxyribonuclease VII large subunit
MTSEPGGDPRTWTIGDLNRRAGRAVVMEFRGRLWVVGELARLDERRGHRYLELVERGGGREGRDAHLAAFCSATRWPRLERRLAEAGVALRVGQRLVLAGCLDVGDRGALTLTVEDVDVAALVGDRLRARQQLVQRLVDDDLFDANRRLTLPRLPLRVGVVASQGTDGHRDVVRQLERSGFAFAVTLRSIPVEGPTAPKAIQAALATLGPADVDLAVLVRGGGAKATLDVFDRGAVAHAIATARVPVWTGIGHTGDRTVADEVAHRSFATPTALAQALVATVAGAWDDLARTMRTIARLVGARLDVNAAQLTMAAHGIRASGTAELRDAHRQLVNLAADAAQAARRTTADAAADLAGQATALSTAATRTLDTNAARCTTTHAVLEAYDPQRQLARGWTLTRTAGGRLVRRAGDLTAGDTLVTTFAAGTATSTVVRTDG